VIEDVRPLLPSGELGERIARAMPEGDGPLLIVPGRIGGSVTTVQFITPEGAKKNILGGAMGGAAHRIATGRETWVCEGIATALSVRAALRLLGRSATVLSAFSASNVAKVAAGLRGAIIAADHDKPVDAFDGLGTGEYYARRSGCTWTQPGERGDFNDMHVRDGLRLVALHLREVRSG
jgi:putative DNA primase/helicase